MLKPNELSDQALAVLRVIAHSGSRKSGNTMSFSAIEQQWKQSRGDLEVGLSDLEAARLVSRSLDSEHHAIVTEDGEAFFKKYFFACY